jgi:hypothetical protein
LLFCCPPAAAAVDDLVSHQQERVVHQISKVRRQRYSGAGARGFRKSPFVVQCAGVDFSHDGKYLAVCERREFKDYVGIYYTESWELIKVGRLADGASSHNTDSCGRCAWLAAFRRGDGGPVRSEVVTGRSAHRLLRFSARGDRSLLRTARCVFLVPWRSELISSNSCVYLVRPAAQYNICVYTPDGRKLQKHQVGSLRCHICHGVAKQLTEPATRNSCVRRMSTLWASSLCSGMCCCCPHASRTCQTGNDSHSWASRTCQTGNDSHSWTGFAGPRAATSWRLARMTKSLASSTTYAETHFALAS